MAEQTNCTHDCSTCSENCASRQTNPADFLEAPHPMSSVKKVIAVASGKGGVGKSMVTSLLAVLLNRQGYKTAILDADITGPSIPKAFGIHTRAMATEDGLLPTRTKKGIGLMSVNLLLEDETAPVIWRGPVIAGAVKQFWTDVIWDNVDFLFVDMPPGTGDVPLTVFQSLPIDGCVVVTSPQALVSMVVSKAVSMAKTMKIPVLGLVENMSYVECPDCKKQIKVFGESNIERIAGQHGVEVLDKLPLNQELTSLSDQGLIELVGDGYLTNTVEKLIQMII